MNGRDLVLGLMAGAAVGALGVSIAQYLLMRKNGPYSLPVGYVLVPAGSVRFVEAGLPPPPGMQNPAPNPNAGRQGGG